MQGLGYEHLEGGQTSDGNIIKDMPKLTGDQLYDTGIGQLCHPVSKTFLPNGHGYDFRFYLFQNNVWP